MYVEAGVCDDDDGCSYAVCAPVVASICDGGAGRCKYPQLGQWGPLEWKKMSQAGQARWQHGYGVRSFS